MVNAILIRQCTDQDKDICWLPFLLPCTFFTLGVVAVLCTSRDNYIRDRSLNTKNLYMQLEEKVGFLKKEIANCGDNSNRLYN